MYIPLKLSSKVHTFSSNQTQGFARDPFHFLLPHSPCPLFPFLSFPFFPSFPSFLLFMSFTFLLGTDTYSPAEPLQPSTDGGRLCVKSGKMASSFHFRWKVVTFSYPAGPFLGGGDAGGWSLTESECVEDGRPSGEAVTARVSDERSEESAR